jgi:hypothetical protein
MEAAGKPEAAEVFDAHPELKGWLVHLAEQRFGKDRYRTSDRQCNSACKDTIPVTGKLCEHIRSILAGGMFPRAFKLQALVAGSRASAVILSR